MGVPGLYSVWDGVVSISHAEIGGTSGECDFHFEEFVSVICRGFARMTADKGAWAAKCTRKKRESKTLPLMNAEQPDFFFRGLAEARARAPFSRAEENAAGDGHRDDEWGTSRLRLAFNQMFYSLFSRLFAARDFDPRLSARSAVGFSALPSGVALLRNSSNEYFVPRQVMAPSRRVTKADRRVANTKINAPRGNVKIARGEMRDTRSTRKCWATIMATATTKAARGQPCAHTNPTNGHTQVNSTAKLASTTRAIRKPKNAKRFFSRLRTTPNAPCAQRRLTRLGPNTTS